MMNKPVYLHLGDMYLSVYPCTSKAQEQFQNLQRPPFHILFTHEATPDAPVDYLIITDSVIADEMSYPSLLSDKQYLIWTEFYNNLAASIELNLGQSSDNLSINHAFIFSWPQSIDRAKSLPSPARQKTQNQYFAIHIAEPRENSYLQMFSSILFLATRRHIECGGLCLHSSAVTKGEKGFLFLGSSGAGKTTVTQISQSLGYQVLSDDLNLVIQGSGNGYQLAMAWPYMPGDATLRPALRGIFTLVQDTRDYLVRLQPLQVAIALFNVLLKQTSYVPKLPDYLIALGFQTICTIARQIPSYELHFRKSPDFWKLIDERFPG